MTVPGVVKEFGLSPALRNVEIIDLKEIISDKSKTDDHLAETAKYLRLPVISEDKKILMQAKHCHLPFFNALMIMNFLLYKEIITRSDYQTALHQLQKEAYYDAKIFEYGKKVYEQIIKKI